MVRSIGCCLSAKFFNHQSGPTIQLWALGLDGWEVWDGAGQLERLPGSSVLGAGFRGYFAIHCPTDGTYIPHIFSRIHTYIYIIPHRAYPGNAQVLIPHGMSRSDGLFVNAVRQPNLSSSKIDWSGGSGPPGAKLIVVANISSAR